MLYQAAEGDQVLAASEPQLTEGEEAVVVVTERRIALVADSGTLVWDIANDPGQPDYTQIQVYSLAQPGEYGVIIAPSYQANHQTGLKLPYHAIFVAESDGVRRRVELPSLRFRGYQPGWQECVSSVVFPPLFVLGLGSRHPDGMGQKSSNRCPGSPRHLGE
jgi:hypothetical protein